MYEAYFGLNENPFSINTDPRYLYFTPRTEEALNSLTQGIEARKGFILLTGEVGTGKTTLLNKLLDSLHRQHAATAFVFNPRMTASQLFDYMIADFGIVCKSRARSHVLLRLNQWLLDRYQNGEQTVLVVDEAQVVSRQTLEEIRLLTNLETSTQKLLQIVLAGQPEIEHKLNQRDLRQLRQRIAVRAKTLPLSPDETRGYILERLRIAGSDGQEVFSPLAIEAIHRHARGVPRVTNLISEQALVRAFFNRLKPIPAEIIDEVAREFALDEAESFEQPLVVHESGRNGHGRNGNGRKHSPRLRRVSRVANVARSSQAAELPLPPGVNQISLPLFIYGYGLDGEPFYEHASTIATNERGGLMSMSTPVRPGQRLIITNKETERSQECVVGFLGAQLARGIDVGFEFSCPVADFWRSAQLEQNPSAQRTEACA